MRIFGRNDVFLVGGLAIAVWVVSSRQLGTLLDRAREIDHSRGLQLVPALFILAAVFVIHQFRKREEMRVKASQRMNTILRSSDIKCRYGGEEFLILLPDTPLSGAQRVSEMLRHDFEEHPVAWNDQAIIITASFGITEIVPGADDAQAIQAIIGRADAALYQAKQDGRNCIRVSEYSKAIA
jgi:predicted signal transduction protein with EAL and GGDEF domain